MRETKPRTVGTSPMRVHKSFVIAYLEHHPEAFRRMVGEYEGTCDQYISALKEFPGEWFHGGVLTEEE